MRRPRTRLPILSIVLWMGCSPPPIPDSGASGDPSIELLFPESATAEEMVYCPNLVVVVNVENYVLDPTFPDNDVDETGHWHFKDNDAYVKASGNEWLQVTLPEGEHRLSVVLATNTHDEIEVSDAAEIVVQDIAGCEGGKGGVDTGWGG